MFAFEILAHPLNKVVLEYSLNELMEQVWSDELVDISVGEVFCERLSSGEFGVRIMQIGLGDSLWLR